MNSSLDNAVSSTKCHNSILRSIVSIRSGRRRVSLIWSPEKASQTPNQIRTPTKATTTMTLRSSPRKRLLIPETASPKTPEKLSTLRHAAATVYSPKQWQPITKRLRFDEKPIAQSNDKVPLATIMMGLSNEQLMNIIQGIGA